MQSRQSKDALLENSKDLSPSVNPVSERKQIQKNMSLEVRDVTPTVAPFMDSVETKQQPRL